MRRISAFQSLPARGFSISVITTSTIPSLEILLARDVVVERHRLDAELPPEAAHAERGDPVPIRDRNRCLEDALPVERQPDRGSLCGPGCHRLTDLTLYVYLTA